MLHTEKIKSYQLSLIFVLNGLIDIELLLGYDKNHREKFKYVFRVPAAYLEVPWPGMLQVRD